MSWREFDPVFTTSGKARAPCLRLQATSCRAPLTPDHSAYELSDADRNVQS